MGVERKGREVIFGIQGRTVDCRKKNRVREDSVFIVSRELFREDSVLIVSRELFVCFLIELESIGEKDRKQGAFIGERALRSCILINTSNRSGIS